MFNSNLELFSAIKKRIQNLNLRPMQEGINLVGLEGYYDKKDLLDQWNDAIVLIILDDQLKPLFVKPYKGTTEPGKYYTVNPLNPGGAARLAIDFFHPGIWGFGLHRGYSALVQISKVTISRDKNKDGFRTGDKITVESGNGINLHHGNNSATVGKYGAGCQVIQSTKDFAELLTKCRSQYPKNKPFDYYLLDSSKL